MKSLFATLVLATTTVFFAVPAGAEELPEEYRFIEALFPTVDISSIRPSPVGGFLEMNVGNDVFYVSEDGRYLLEGDIYEIVSRVNLTERTKSGFRLDLMDEFDDEGAIVFESDSPIATVSVFTDIDCGYCRKFHRQIAEYNDLGISVRYLFFPRSGPGSESWLKAEDVWCAESPKEALTKAKNNEEFQTEPCDASMIERHYKTVLELGVTGTPAIMTETGMLLIGYRSPDQLLDIVDSEI